jgi:hypothetical protein
LDGEGFLIPIITCQIKMRPPETKQVLKHLKERRIKNKDKLSQDCPPHLTDSADLVDNGKSVYFLLCN